MLQEIHNTLVNARNLLVEKGWVRNVLRDHEGRYCAVGAVCQSMIPDSTLVFPWYALDRNNPVFMGALKLLAEQIPSQPELGYAVMESKEWLTVAFYNNSRNDFIDILAMFDGAINAAEKQLLPNIELVTVGGR